MALQNFVDRIGPVVSAAWLNTVDYIVQAYERTAAEIAQAIVPVNYSYPPYHLWRYLPLNPDLTGATDYSTQIQNWINVLEAYGYKGYAPAGIYGHSSTINITDTTEKGFLLEGEWVLDYGTSYPNPPTRGTIFKYNGAGVAWQIEGSTTTTSPKYVGFRNIAFRNGGTATDGMVVLRATWIELDNVLFAYFSGVNSNGLRLTHTYTGTPPVQFTGGITGYQTAFVGCYRGIYIEASPINAIYLYSPQFHSCVRPVQQGNNAAVSYFTRALQLHSPHFEGDLSECDLMFYGGVELAIFGGTVEQNNAALNDPRIWIRNTGSSPLSTITIIGMGFSKQLQAAGQRLIYLDWVSRVLISNCTSYHTGVLTDRYWVEVNAVVGPDSRVIIDRQATAFGVTPYPIRIAGTNYSTSYNNDQTTFTGSNLITIANGGASAPSLALASEPTTGFYRRSAGELSASVNGIQRFSLTGSATSTELQLWAADPADTGDAFIRFCENDGTTKGFLGFTASVDDSFTMTSVEDFRLKFRTGDGAGGFYDRAHIYGNGATESWLAIESPRTDDVGGCYLRYTENDFSVTKGLIGFTSTTDNDLDIINQETNAHIDMQTTGTGVVKCQPPLALVDGITAPSPLSGFGLIFIDAADGDLKIQFPDGTLKLIVTDT